MRQVFNIWLKEMKDTIRDKRTLMSMLVMPILIMPLIIVGMGKLAEYQTNKAKEQVSKIAIYQEVEVPELVAAFKKQNKLEIVEAKGDLKEFVRSQKADAAVVIPPNYSEFIKDYKPMQIKVMSQSTNDKSSIAMSRISTTLGEFNNSTLAKRFIDNKIDPSIVSTLSIQVEDVATDQEKGGFGLGFILPLLIMMWAITGGQYTATDASAGEKERKTLEPLLMTPVSRIQLVLGKFFAVSTVSLVSVVASLGSLYFALTQFGLGSALNESSNTPVSSQSNMFNVDFTLEPQALLIMFAASLFLVLMFSAVILSIAIFAKSFKEAQSYISPAYMVVILPAVFVNTIPGFKPALAFFALPAINTLMLFKEVLLGVYDLSHITVTITSLIIYSAVAIIIATRIYSNEEVLLRS